MRRKLVLTYLDALLMATEELEVGCNVAGRGSGVYSESDISPSSGSIKLIAISIAQYLVQLYASYKQCRAKGTKYILVLTFKYACFCFCRAELACNIRAYAKYSELSQIYFKITQYSEENYLVSLDKCKLSKLCSMKTHYLRNKHNLTLILLEIFGCAQICPCRPTPAARTFRTHTGAKSKKFKFAFEDKSEYKYFTNVGSNVLFYILSKKYSFKAKNKSNILGFIFSRIFTVLKTNKNLKKSGCGCGLLQETKL